MPSRPTFFRRLSSGGLQLLPPNLTRFLPHLMLCVTLAGCAAQTAYREGKDLIAQDKVEQGLQKFQQAAQLDPHDARYKSAFLETRDRSVQALLEKADRAMDKGQYVDADKLYNRILGFDANNERAKAGLQAIAMDQRHRQVL